MTDNFSDMTDLNSLLFENYTVLTSYSGKKPNLLWPLKNPP